MAETTQLELVTPARIMAQKSVQMVLLHRALKGYLECCHGTRHCLLI